MKYAIVNTDTGEVARTFEALPGSFEVGDKRIVSPVEVGDEGLGHRFVELVEVDFQQPGTYFTQGVDTSVLTGDTLTITRTWTPWTQPEIDAYEVARKDQITNDLDVNDSIIRAAVLVILDEFNKHAAVSSQILAAVAASTTLANLKTGIAAITPIAQRTPAQIKTAIRQKIDEA